MWINISWVDGHRGGICVDARNMAKAWGKILFDFQHTYIGSQGGTMVKSWISIPGAWV